MTTYTIYAKPDDQLNAIFVAEKFSWPAFVFTGFWTLRHRMWIVSAVLISALLLSYVLPLHLQVMFSIAVSFLLGIHANDLLSWSLMRRGFSEIGMAVGRNLEEAELRFFSGFEFAAGDQQPVPKFSMASHEPLGLFGAGN